MGPGSVVTSTRFQGSRNHQVYFRSPRFGLLGFNPYYWWLAPDYFDPEILPPSPAPPTGPRLSGGLQLDVEPRHAFVYVDGFLVGTVDQFKGYFQHLETAAGYHVVEFVAPDYEPLMTGVTVVPNRTTTYRTSLNRASGR